MKKELQIVFYDIETSLSKFIGFRPGEQYVNHKQLLKGYLVTPIICLSYAINNGKPKTITYDLTDASTKEMIREFDEIIKDADIVIGKNNFRFDDKHLNYHRMLNRLPQLAEWKTKSDDLESHLRKNFFMSSYTLDHISEILGLGGKVKMDMSDWLDILAYQTAYSLAFKILKSSPKISQENLKASIDAYCRQEYDLPLTVVKSKGKKALYKMEFYNRKDVEDTRTIWNYCNEHFQPKFNHSAYLGILCCKQTGCGSTDLKKNGKRLIKKAWWQTFYCNSCNRHAGRIKCRKDGTYNNQGILE